MIFKVGDGPWMIRVQTPTYSYDLEISDDMVCTISTIISKEVCRRAEDQ